jgi:dolichol-phosphate mannosyltransferase
VNSPLSAETNSDPQIAVSVIVPTLNESANLPLLVPQVAAALEGRVFEILIVDDNSRDQTPAVCVELARTFPLRLLVRNEPKHGLSGAVLHGIAAAWGETLVIMDADLQHPPQRIGALLEALDSGADFALGSRNVQGGSTDDQWTFFRKLNSGVATMLARPFAAGVRDPMSGFFALRRSTFDRAERLTPLGYKIALELMCKCRVKQLREVPIHFGLRTHGESKLTIKQQFRYLEHLSRLYDFTFPRASPIIKYLIATSIGLFVGLCVFGALLAAGSDHVSATVWGYVGSILVTAVFHVRYVRTQREFLLTRRPWLDFLAICALELLTVFLSARWLAHRAADAPAIEAFLISFGCATVLRYVLRKELLQDVRGLRKNSRAEDIIA